MKVEIFVPSHVDEITLEQFQRFEKVNTEDNQGTAFLRQKMLEIFCNVDLKDVAQVRYSDLLEVTDHIYTLLNDEYELVPTFSLDGVQYGFIPMLEDITLGEYIDLDNYFGSWSTMDKAMSVLYRPVEKYRNGRYAIADYEGSNDHLKHMPVGIAFGATLFFWSLEKELLTAILSYLEMGEGNLDSDQRKALIESGVGIRASMHSLSGILQSLNISPR